MLDRFISVDCPAYDDARCALRQQAGRVFISPPYLLSEKESSLYLFDFAYATGRFNIAPRNLNRRTT
jgi:hypothetical protein